MKAMSRFKSAGLLSLLVIALVLTAGPAPAMSTAAADDVSFVEHTITNNYDGARAVHAVDMDGDGDMDVVGGAEYDGAIYWWENDGRESFTGRPIALRDRKAAAVHAIDLDGDGDMDVVTALNRQDEIAWWDNDGDETFYERTIATDFNGASDAYPVDLDRDGEVDVVGTALYDDQIA